ncbi:MAG: ExeA family protein [Deltaproteobacteria bacterium]
MSYYRSLGLSREPFSTSPDPDFFYRSSSHITALKRLEIAIRLRRGMSLIIGDVGTGKTTLWRALTQEFRDEPEFAFHVMLDPGFGTEGQFLRALDGMFGADGGQEGSTDPKIPLEKYLFRKGVDENGTVVLIIDEGQKLNAANIETLRTLLNYETNEHKLLQLVIMAQVEILPRIAGMKNFTDRISLKYTLNPLDEEETREMICFRLRQAGYKRRFDLFTPAAVKAVYARSGGYPRKINLLCHEALKTAVVREKDVIDEGIVEEILLPTFEYEQR